MKFKTLALAMAVAATTALTGCQTASSIDTKPAMANNQATIASHKLALGSTFFSAGNYGSAEKSYREAVEATPENGEAWLGLAAAYDQLGRFDLADRAYENLIRIEGRKPSILNNYGYSNLLRGDRKKARKLLQEARSAAPSAWKSRPT